MNGEIIGSDFDGAEWCLDMIRPRFIISGRHISRIPETKRKIQELGLNPDEFIILHSPNREENIVYTCLFKAQQIKDHKITIYYEDHPLIAHFLRSACPGVNIIVVPSSIYKNECLSDFEDREDYFKLIYM